jgi:hypothetical protein
MEKNKKFTLEQAIEEIQKYLLNRLHREREIYLTIQKPPKPSVLAWFNTRDGQLYITDNLAQWSVELLYVLPLHEEVHKVCFGIIKDYENGYHNVSFRKLFETMSGMTTYHDEKVGWQFIEKVGDKYIEWLKEKRHILNEIFDVIALTDLPPQEKEEGEEGEEGEGENSENGANGENSDNGANSENKARSKMNKALEQNQDNDKSQGEESDNGEKGEEGEKSQSETKGGKGEYQGQRENVEVKGGKKKFKL